MSSGQPASKSSGKSGAKSGALSVAEALARILDGVTPLAAETVALEQAHGRSLAEPLTARA